MATVTICSDFGAQENKVCHFFQFFPFYLPWSYGTWCHDLSFLNAEFKPAFSLSSFIFINRLFSSSLLSAIKVVSSAYLRLLIFSQQSWFQPVIHPAQHFSWCIYSAYKLKKQNDNIQCWHTPLPILNQSMVVSKVFWYSHLFKKFPQFSCVQHKSQSL